jgi:hypothetical protein
MRNEVIFTLLVVAILAGAGAGFFTGSSNTHATTITTTSTETTIMTTTATPIIQGNCSPLGGSSIALPVGFRVTVSYEGDWSVSIATFAAKSTNAGDFFSACSSTGAGTTTFYVGLANYTGGWNTILAMAHKFGSSGNLTVTASIGNETSSSSTARPYGSATTTLSFNFVN